MIFICKERLPLGVLNAACRVVIRRCAGTACATRQLSLTNKNIYEGIILKML